MTLFSLVGLLTSLRLKSELEECLAKIEAMTVQAKVSQFVALGQLEGKPSRYPRFRWIFPIFYTMTTALHYTDRVSAGHRRSNEVTRPSELNTDSNRMTQPAKCSFKRKLRVCYPPGTGTLVIRTELDWERDVHPTALSSDGTQLHLKSKRSSRSCISNRV